MKKLEETVFTTRYVIDNNSIIISVFHDEEDTWQFFSHEDIDEKDGRVVGLGEIIKMDSTIKDVLYIPRGFKAIREDLTSDWIVSKIE